MSVVNTKTFIYHPKIMLFYNIRTDSVLALRRLENREILLNDVIRLSGGHDPTPKRKCWISPDSYTYQYCTDKWGNPSHATVRFERLIRYQPELDKKKATSFVSGERKINAGIIHTRIRRNWLPFFSIVSAGIALAASLSSIYFGYSTIAGNRPYLSAMTDIVIAPLVEIDPEVPKFLFTITNVGKRPASKIHGRIFVFDKASSALLLVQNWEIGNDLAEDLNVVWSTSQLIHDGVIEDKAFFLELEYTDSALGTEHAQSFGFISEGFNSPNHIQPFQVSHAEMQWMAKLLRSRGFEIRSEW